MNEWSTSDLVIIVPILGRAHRVEPLMDSIRRATPAARVLFVCTPGDAEVIATIEAQPDLDSYALSPWPSNGRGDYCRKINMGYRVSDEPLMFLGADDLDFEPGWFETATAHVGGALVTTGTTVEPVAQGVPEIEVSPPGPRPSETYLVDGLKILPQPLVVGTNDGHNPRTADGTLSTHSLVTRTYADYYGVIDQPGAVLCEGYWHEYCDNELVATAKHRGMYVHEPRALVRHLHPDYGLAPPDLIYTDQRRERQRWGRKLYERRRPQWESLATSR